MKTSELSFHMIETATEAALALGAASADVVAFVRSSMNPDGGFMNRAGSSDLYYSLFGAQCLAALHAPIDGVVRRFVERFDGGGELDFMHACCLARLWGMDELDLLDGVDARALRALAERIEQARCLDGGYGLLGSGPCGSVYGCFLALLAYEGLGIALPQPSRFATCFRGLRARDGGYANEPGIPAGTTTATAAALVLQQHFGEPVDCAASAWMLKRLTPSGGFLATPGAPVPDLLSTATALFACAHLGIRLPRGAHGRCSAFCTGLLDPCGGFRAVQFDGTTDCEYTYYGLLALGALHRMQKPASSDSMQTGGGGTRFGASVKYGRVKHDPPSGSRRNCAKRKRLAGADV